MFRSMWIDDRCLMCRIVHTTSKKSTRASYTGGCSTLPPSAASIPARLAGGKERQSNVPLTAEIASTELALLKSTVTFFTSPGSWLKGDCNGGIGGEIMNHSCRT